MQPHTIQNLLLSIPDFTTYFKRFFSLPQESKIKVLMPIAVQLEEYKLDINHVIDLIDNYSRNLYIQNIEKVCDKLIDWLLAENRQAEDGSWPLAGQPGDVIRKNSWANAVCTLALLKFRRYRGIARKEYDEKISNSIKWLFDTHNGIYIPNEGWKQYPDDTHINYYETAVSLKAIFKYRSVCKKEDFTYEFSDREVVEIVSGLLILKDESDVGAISYCLMTLIHFCSVFEDEMDEILRERIEQKIMDLLQWIIQKYEEGIGWSREGVPSLELSCYAAQALNKCKYNFLDRLNEPSDPTKRMEKLWGDVVRIISSEMARLERCFTFSGGVWGWPNECGKSDAVHLRNSALATSSLLKCCYRSNFVIDLSIVIRAINYLIDSFEWDRITLDNTNILCAIIDYLIFREQRNLVI